MNGVRGPRAREATAPLEPNFAKRAVSLMCHVLLLLPVLALPAMWLLPIEVALPVYGAAASIALGAWALVYRARSRPLLHGLQTLLGATGRVVHVGERQFTLQVGRELWLADVQGASPALGEKAIIVAIDGLRLKARRADSMGA